MSAEVPATPEAPAEPAPAVTAPEPAKPEEPDYRAAYVGLQRSQNKLHRRLEDVSGQNAALAETIRVLKDGQQAILKQTLGEDEAKALEAREATASERAASLRAAQAGQSFIVAQTGMYLETLAEVGVNPNDTTIDWARDAGSVEEWRERVGPSIRAAIKRAIATRIQQHELSLKAKTAKEVEAEAEALTQQQLKAAGVDKIDTAKGSSTGTFADRVRNMDRSTPEGEARFQKMLTDAKRGTLKT